MVCTGDRFHFSKDQQIRRHFSINQIKNTNLYSNFYDINFKELSAVKNIFVVVK